MSYSSQNRAIQPFKLLGESFSQVGPVYLPLLLLAIPVTVLSIGGDITKKPVLIDDRVNWNPTVMSQTCAVLTLIVICLLFGGTFLLAYRYIKQGTLDFSGSIRQGLLASVPILVGGTVYGLAMILGLVLLVIPGIYLWVALSFFAYGILTENYSILDSFKYSLALVKGRWWATFGSLSVQLLPMIPCFILSYLLGIAVGTAIDLADSKQASIELAVGIVGGLAIAVLTPILNVYNAKLYLRLQETMDRPPSDS
jgi:hypothetical protein